MNRLRLAVCVFAACFAAHADTLWDGFRSPPDSAKPWCYWWWINGHADRETITADLESMKEMGFAGLLMFDSRGYWEDDDHLRYPKAELEWGSDRWLDLVEFSIRECARLGLKFTMNASASGGKLNGFKDGREYDVDVFSRDEVRAHLDRVIGSVVRRVPNLVGTVFTHIYSVSYEGGLRDGGTWLDLKDGFYREMHDWARERNLKVYSEASGPWMHGAKALVSSGARNAEMFDHVDFPQGEFWPLQGAVLARNASHANANAKYFCRAAVVAARRRNLPIVSAEAFTHMHHHWSVDPAFLKPTADQAFADGVNHLVWHTFTCSPKKYGVPGVEYFAGSHINRNVTWHREAAPFVRYLGRCQYMLRQGEPVDDGKFVNITSNYYGWGRFRADEKARFTWAHRKFGNRDMFFVAGEGQGDVVFNAGLTGRIVEIWDPVTAAIRSPVSAVALPDGKTGVALDLPVGGSCFVIFTSDRSGDVSHTEHAERIEIGLTNAWSVAFAYHDGITAPPPKPIAMDTLRDFTTYGEEGKAESTSLRYFSGTTTYRTTVELAEPCVCAHGEARLSLGSLPSGLAHIFVNGKDCGTVWCAPWEADISSALREGENEIVIRYVNNWHNRLVGDCVLLPEHRVTKSNVHYWTERQYGKPGRRQTPRPRLHTGPAANDPLQSSGVRGPVSILMRQAHKKQGGCRGGRVDG